MNELRESRHAYDKSKEAVIIFDDDNLRRKIFRYYLKTTERINLLEYQQRRKQEIEKKFNELRRDIQIREPKLSPQEVEKVAITLMANENAEYESLRASIQSIVDKLGQFKSEAEALLAELKTRL